MNAVSIAKNNIVIIPNLVLPYIIMLKQYFIFN